MGRHSGHPAVTKYLYLGRSGQTLIAQNSRIVLNASLARYRKVARKEATILRKDPAT